MTEVNIYNQKLEIVGKEKLSEQQFAVEANEVLIHQAYVAQMSNERQVLAHTKDRSEVRGGGRKPWAQKGTGRARVGSNRSPIWIGGGVTFGPTKDRNFKKKINKKMKQKALAMVLTDKVKSNNFILLDKVEVKDFKTKDVDKVLQKAEKEIVKGNKEEKKAKRSILLIDIAKNEKLKFSARNLEGVGTINANNINILDLLKYRNLVLTKDALEIIQKPDKK